MGLGSGEQYESRFLRKCIDGGHADIGHRRRAVGNQDFPRHVNRQETGVEQETSDQEEVRDKGNTSAAAEVLLFQLPTKNSRRSSFPTLTLRPCARSARAARSSWFQVPHHFGFYLMIVARSPQ